MSQPSTPTVYDAEFFIDTVCPWCWITSRWVTNVQAERDLEVGWRFISLKFLNEGVAATRLPTPTAAHSLALRSCGCCHAVREQEGNDAVAALYTAIGTASTRTAVAATHACATCGSARGLKEAELDQAYAGTSTTSRTTPRSARRPSSPLSRTGARRRTPIITFHLAPTRAGTLFGPVIPQAPKGDEAVALWDAVASSPTRRRRAQAHLAAATIVFD